MLVVMLLAGLLGVAVAPVAGAAGRFSDDDGSVHEADIEAIAAVGITLGCNPPANDEFCPSDAVTREQMASFFVRALDLAPAGGDRFSDDDGSVHEADIEAIAVVGITLGCNPPANDEFCPGDPVTREQMASFFVRALDLAAADVDRFVDDDGSVHEADIEAIAAVGITLGCNPPANDEYCPGDPVTREQMASFFVRALDLPPAPTTSTTSTTTTDPTGTSTSTSTSSSSSSTSSSSTSSSSTSTSSTTSTTTTTIPEGSGTFTNLSLTPVPIPLTDADAAVIDGRLFVVGGKTGDNGGNATKALHIYDPTGGWLPGPQKDDAATALEDQTVVAANGHLYVIGGSTGAFATFKNEVWVYTPAGENLDMGTWTEGPSLPVALSGATAVVHEGEIWVIGGMAGTTGGTSRDEVLVLGGLDPGDPTQGTWSLDESMNQARDNAGAAVLDGKIHVFGGRERVEGTTIEEGLASYEVLSGGTWNLVDAAGEFVGRRSFVVGTLNGDVQIIGGEDPVQDANQNFDAQTGAWTNLQPLSPARHGAAYATLGDTVYIVGGSTDDTNHTDLFESFTLP